MENPSSSANFERETPLERRRRQNRESQRRFRNRKVSGSAELNSGEKAPNFDVLGATAGTCPRGLGRMSGSSAKSADGAGADLLGNWLNGFKPEWELRTPSDEDSCLQFNTKPLPIPVRPTLSEVLTEPISAHMATSRELSLGWSPGIGSEASYQERRSNNSLELFWARSTSEESDGNPETRSLIPQGDESFIRGPHCGTTTRRSINQRSPETDSLASSSVPNTFPPESNRSRFKRQKLSRAEMVITEVEQLYQFGLRFGLLGEHKGMGRFLQEMKRKFAAISALGPESDGIEKTYDLGSSADDAYD